MNATDAVEKQETPRETLRRMAEARLLAAVDRGEEWAIRFALELTTGEPRSARVVSRQVVSGVVWPGDTAVGACPDRGGDL